MNRVAHRAGHKLKQAYPPTPFRIVAAGLLMAGGFGGAAVLAEDEPLPDCGWVLDQSLEAIGGKAVIAKLKNRVTKGTLEIAGFGISGPTALYNARPNRQYFLFESEGLGKQEEGTNGQVAWSIDPITGPQVKKGEQRSLALRDAVFDGEVQWRKYYKSAKCAGIEEVNQAPCHKVIMTPFEGNPETRYYDKKTHLAVKFELDTENLVGSFHVTVTFSDYRRVDGLLLPHKIVQVIGDGLQTMVFTTDSIEHNTDIPEDRFDLPAEIQALQEANPEPKPKNRNRGGRNRRR